MGILTVAVVTRPFGYEGKRVHIAQEGLEQLKGQVDSLIIIPNDKLMTALGEDVTMREAFRAADNVLRDAVAGISEVVTRPGFINLDFADVKNVMGIKGIAMMGSGFAQGIDRARLATEQAISSPLGEDAIRVTIIATGLKENGSENQMRAAVRTQKLVSGNAEAAQPVQAGNVDGLVRTNRGIRSMNLTAADFSNQSVLDDFEIPAILRRQNNSDK